MPEESIHDRIQEVFINFENQTKNREELDRLRAFYARMKKEGVATTREYDIPQLDTIGRSVVDSRNQSKNLDVASEISVNREL